MVGTNVEPPWCDGIVNTVRNWCEGLANIDVGVTVCSTASSRRTPVQLNNVSYKYFHLCSKRFKGYPLISVPFQYALTKDTDFLDHDMYHFSGFDTPCLLPTSLLLKIKHKRRIASFFNADLSKLNRFFRSSMFDGFVAISLHVKERLIKNNVAKSKVAVIPPCVDVELFSPRNKASARNRFCIPEDAFVILHLGHFRRGRGIVDLLSVFNRLKKSNEGRVFLVIGWTGHGDETTKSIFDLAHESNGVKIIGPTEDVHLLYNVADVFVSPVLNDNYAISLPLSIIESLSSGCPVISTNMAGVQNVLKHRINCYLYQPGNLQQLKELLCSCMEEKVELEALSENGRKIVVSRFSQEVVAKRLTEFYEKLS